MGEMRIFGVSATVMPGDDIGGDRRLSWDSENAAQVAEAEKVFDYYIRKGWVGLGEAGGKTSQVFVFDAGLDTITLVPMMMGGDVGIAGWRLCRQAPQG
ncbi:MAG: hypothetical protein HY675_12535 [Chloroflexi bacterium]|nr:hypothetical protein [Chloroflexota bacterium]